MSADGPKLSSSSRTLQLSTGVHFKWTKWSKNSVPWKIARISRRVRHPYNWLHTTLPLYRKAYIITSKINKAAPMMLPWYIMANLCTDVVIPVQPYSVRSLIVCIASSILPWKTSSGRQGVFARTIDSLGLRGYLFLYLCLTTTNSTVNKWVHNILCTASISHLPSSLCRIW